MDRRSPCAAKSEPGVAAESMTSSAGGMRPPVPEISQPFQLYRRPCRCDVWRRRSPGDIARIPTQATISSAPFRTSDLPSARGAPIGGSASKQSSGKRFQCFRESASSCTRSPRSRRGQRLVAWTLLREHAGIGSPLRIKGNASTERPGRIPQATSACAARSKPLGSSERRTTPERRVIGQGFVKNRHHPQTPHKIAQ